MKSWVEISEQRLIDNYRVLTDAAGSDTAILAVVKSNAYGHGAAVCAPVLAHAGAEWLGVADASEGASLREALAAAHIAPRDQPQILVMCGPLEGDAPAIVRHGLTPVVWEQSQLETLAAAVRQHGGVGASLPVHLEIDTGMARQGIPPGEPLHTLLHWLKRQPLLRLDGVLTHFASAEVVQSHQTFDQRTQFEEAIAAIIEVGLRPAWVHAGSSSTLDNGDTEANLPWLRNLAASIGARPMVRPGIALYGYCLPIEQTSRPHDAQSKVQCKLKPLMTWKTRILSLRDVQTGDAIGYNATFRAEHPMRLALLPIGYSDGLRRELSSSNAHPGGWAMVHGVRAAIVGRISMNLTVVDVTEIPGVAVGDEVVVLGDGITADDHARFAHTISYEIVCGVRASSSLVG